MMGKQILKYLDCSTSHISRKTMELLEAGDGIQGFTIAPYLYGAFVSVPSAESLEDKESERMPADLLVMMKFARSVDCDVIRFDQAADIIEDAPQYDW